MTRMSIDEYPAGLVELCQRGPEDECSIPMIESVPVEEVTFGARLDTDEGSGIAVEISALQVSDGKDRAFHVRTEAHLDWDAVRRLHAFLSALIAVRGTVVDLQDEGEPAVSVPTSVGIETLDECIRRMRVICSHAACPMVCDLPYSLEVPR